MKWSMWRCAGLAVAVVLSCTPAWAQYTLQMDFEAPTYTAGNLAGQNGWTTLTSGGEAVIVTTDNGPAAAGTQAVQLTNVGGELRLRYDFIADLVTYGRMIEIQYDLKNVTNKDGTPWGVPSRLHSSRVYDGVNGWPAIGSMHYDGGGGPACQSWDSPNPNGSAAGWGPDGSPAWTDVNWHTVKWTMIYDPDNLSGRFVAVTFDGVVYCKNRYFPDWADPNTPGADIATRADWFELRIYGASYGADDVFLVDNYRITASDPPPLPVAHAGSDQVIPATCGELVSVQLDGSASVGAASYTWYEGGRQIATGMTPTVQLLTGVHYITLTVGGAFPCTSASDDVKITVGTPLPLPIDIPMDTQVNYSDYGDMIYQPVYGVDPLAPWWDGFAEVAEIYVGEDIYGAPTDYTTGYMLLGESWYHGPWVQLLKTCYGTMDLSDPSMRLRFTARYFQDASNWACDPADPNCSPKPYQDAPIMVTLRDAFGRRGCLGICYGANFYDPTIDGQPNPLYGHQYPEWLDIDVDIEDYLALHPGVGTDLSDYGFDLSMVTRIEFHGTDWGGAGFDEFNIKNLWIGPVAPPYCLGDLNCDGQVSFGDINPFVLYLSNYAAWQTTYAGCNPKNGDINDDGAYPGFGDINPFVTLLSTSSLPIDCP
ncbi:MAG: hypothetical protein KA383_19750 [Phycisphaerae bacterium]|nr:hypothetical protein [Phycisphaerae bacterium]